jgi:hypothetical protein
MTTMKTTILILALLFSVNAYSQKIDSVKVIAVEKQLESFKPIVKEYLNKIQSSSSLDSINIFGKALEEESDALILEIKTTFKINDNYLIEYATDMALSQALPNLASFYQTSAILKLSDGMNQKRPNYLTSLLNINDNARKLKTIKKMEKVKKCSNRILIGHQELSAINSKANNKI